MMCLASHYELKFRVWSLLARPHGQACAGPVLNVFFLSKRMLYLASDCELRFLI
jgi:hypothetical protein